MVRNTWTLIDLVGQGGFGLVFTARHHTLGRVDCIKFLHPRHASDDELRLRFAREAKIMARLHGDQLVHVYDYGEHEGLPYFVMEYLQGQPLNDWLAARGAAPLDDFYCIAGGLLRGLSEIHAHGVVHRDIKPANILIVSKNRVKILDFGLAKTSMRLTTRGAIMGTLPYMAPELLRSPQTEASVTTDVYAAGMVLYRMLAGRLPYSAGRAGNISDLIRDILDTAPQRPSESGLPVPRPLEDLVLRAIHSDPAQRPRDAQSFAEALEQARSAVPLVAPRPPATRMRGGVKHPVVAVPAVPPLTTMPAWRRDASGFRTGRARVIGPAGLGFVFRHRAEGSPVAVRAQDEAATRHSIHQGSGPATSAWRRAWRSCRGLLARMKSVLCFAMGLMLSPNVEPIDRCLMVTAPEIVEVER